MSWLFHFAETVPEMNVVPDVLAEVEFNSECHQYN